MQSSRPEKEQQSLIKRPFKFKQAFTRRTTDIRETSITSGETKLPSMAALQRFKHLATQCGVAPSPTRSPRTSPLVHLRRRRTTLRSILLGRRASGGIRVPPRERGDEEKALVVKRSSLKDLFVSSSSSSSSPPLELRVREQRTSVAGEKSAKEEEASRAGSGTPRPGWSGFRYRSLLLRRAWRPVLVTIPE